MQTQTTMAIKSSFYDLLGFLYILLRYGKQVNHTSKDRELLAVTATTSQHLS